MCSACLVGILLKGGSMVQYNFPFSTGEADYPAQHCDEQCDKCPSRDTCEYSEPELAKLARSDV